MLASMPLSLFGMSLSQIILAINWFAEGKIKKKTIAFFHDKVALVVVSIFILHVIGLIYSSDFAYAMKDLRIKSPIFILPVILSTTDKISIRQLYKLLLIFVSSVFLATLISTYHFIKGEYLDIRDISVFTSHIRFGLMICFSVLILVYLFFKKVEFSTLYRSLFFAVFLWLAFFLIILEAFTGIAILLIILLIYLIYFIFKEKNRVYKYLLLLVLIAFPTAVFVYINSIYTESVSIKYVDLSKLDVLTAHGNLYTNNLESEQRENGNLVDIYICKKELEETWKKKSKFDINGKDLKGQFIYATLLRYLTSLNKRKDADGVNGLTDEQIIQIEKGIANAKYQNNFSIRDRILESFWEIQNFKINKNPNGLTLIQRYIYWKTSIELIKQNPIIGVGTGDLNTGFNNHYDKYYKDLEKKYRWRSHNQYLSITVTFGILGFIWFIFALFYPMIKMRKTFNYLFITFFIIFILSMLTEDTLETQAGVTFFAFFNSLFLFAQEEENSDEKK